MIIRKFTCLLVAIFMSACVHKPAELALDEAPYKVSRDYEAIGDSTGIRPYVYGKRTLIKIDQGKSFSPSIKDELGATVNYKVQGCYYVLDRKLDTFTLYGSGHLVKFILIPPKKLDLSEENVDVATENETESQDVAETEVIIENQKKIITSDPIYAVMYEQMQHHRKLLRLAGENPKYTGDELFAINSRLDDIEYKIVHGNRALVHVYFPFNDTVFNPDKALINALLPLAKNAARVNLYGRTDSKVADSGNKIVAIGRTENAKEFLVSNGVSPDIIRTSWRASGDFIVPADMEDGRKLNRRVTIEVIAK